MRWRNSHHDPRQIDLLAIAALLTFVLSAGIYLDWPQPPRKAALIVPSQNVRW